MFLKILLTSQLSYKNMNRYLLKQKGYATFRFMILTSKWVKNCDLSRIYLILLYYTSGRGLLITFLFSKISS